MTVCNRDDPKVNECIKDTVNNLLPTLKVVHFVLIWTGLEGN